MWSMYDWVNMPTNHAGIPAVENSTYQNTSCKRVILQHILETCFPLVGYIHRYLILHYTWTYLSPVSIRELSVHYHLLADGTVVKCATELLYCTYREPTFIPLAMGSRFGYLYMEIISKSNLLSSNPTPI